MDLAYDTLFPDSLSNNSKIYKNISLDKMPGRHEVGLNLDRRKVQRVGAAIILK